METTKEPIVFVHGFFGWGETSPLFNWFPPYWPVSQIQKLNLNFRILEIGVGSSDHDRACEAFYQLYGGRVDYGAEHATYCGHKQFGITYETPLYPEWSETNPIHLVGHSYGATTSIELYQLICDDFFGVGSNHKWVKSITSIAGPLTGSTFGHLLGVQQDETIKFGSLGHMIGVSCGVFWKLQKLFPILKGVYNFRMDQWEFHNSWTKVTSVSHPLNVSKDNAYHSIIPKHRIKRNATLRHMDKIYLFSIVCKAQDRLPYKHLIGIILIGIFSYYGRRGTVAPRNWLLRWLFYKPSFHFRAGVITALLLYMIKQTRKLDFAHAPLLAGMVWSIRKNVGELPKLYSEWQPEMWEHNDGVVNTYSMMYPRYPKQNIQKTPSQTDLSLLNTTSNNLQRIASHLSVDLIEEDNHYERGRWYIYRVNKNHFCGTFGDRSAESLYSGLFRMLKTLKT